MARFKIDENLPNEAATILAEAGHDAMTVHEQGLSGRDDLAIGEVCRSEDRAILTLDRGFGDPRRHATTGTAGIIVLRTYNQDGPHVLDLVRVLVRLLTDRSPRAALWILDPDRLRIRGGERR